MISSCQLFLMPVAEGGPAVGMDPTPLASLIRLKESTQHSFNDIDLIEKLVGYRGKKNN